jgi:hypothetical protein
MIELAFEAEYGELDHKLLSLNKPSAPKLPHLVCTDVVKTFIFIISLQVSLVAFNRFIVPITFVFTNDNGSVMNDPREIRQLNANTIKLMFSKQSVNKWRINNISFYKV